MNRLTRFISWCGEKFFELTTSPNSADGLRHRAKKLVDSGYSIKNPMVQALLRQAELKEMKNDETA